MEGYQDFIQYHEDFLGHSLIPLAADAAGRPLIKSVTGSGPPTATGTADGLAVALEATSEVQNICVYFGDILNFLASKVRLAYFRVKATGSLAAAVQMAWGLASARNATIDSIATHALFRLIGSNSLVVETDDGVRDNDDIATGLSIGTTLVMTKIDFSDLANVKFYAQNSNGDYVQCAKNTTFDMSAASSATLQPFIQVQKTSGTAVGTLTVNCLGVDSLR